MYCNLIICMVKFRYKIIITYSLGGKILALESNLKGNDKIIEGQQKEIEQMKAFIEDNEYNLTPEFKRYFPVGFRY
jgi:hypothetical protein